MDDPQEPTRDRWTELPITAKHVRWAILVLVVAIIVTTLLLRNELTDARDLVNRLGYPAVFLMSIIGAAGMVIPLPSTAAIFFGGALLTPVYVGLIAGVGEAMGEITGYAVGYSGQGVISKNRFYPRIERWVRERGWTVVLLFSIMPNPLFDALGIAAGALRLPLRQFLFVAWIGKTIKNIGIAFAGSLGANWVLDLLGR